jgi:hypothetical protein
MIADHTNAALEEAGCDARVDERSYKDLGIRGIYLTPPTTTGCGLAFVSRWRYDGKTQAGSLSRQLRALTDGV